jgi:hypothetical protein
MAGMRASHVGGGDAMNPMKWAGVVLVVLGGMGLIYGGFSYTRQSQKATLGPLELTVSERKTVNVPVWAGGAAVAAGVLLLVLGGRRR